jgi:hypothetical protein
MSDTYFRYDGVVQTPQGNAVAGASIAVLGDNPPDFSTQPGSPLLDIFSGPNSNSATITAAQWIGGQITFTFSTTPPTDVVPNSYISVSGVTPSGFDAIYEVISVDGDEVIVGPVINSPGTYVSGGTVATSVLPNPLASDGNGRYFFYVLPGLVAVQIYGGAVLINELDLPDQGIGTVAGGSVLSVAMTGDGVIFNATVPGSPITTSGTLAPALLTHPANTVLAGPATGAAAAPTFRALVAADLPAGGGTVTSVGVSLSVPSFLTASVTGSPITGAGTIAETIGLATQSANTFLAGPTSGGASIPNFRALVVGDIPVAGYTTFGAGIFQGAQQDTVQTASGSADAITFPGSVFVTTAGVDAMALATPTAGGPGTGNDGDILRITDAGGHAHTVTAASNKIVPSHHLITFNGTVGSWIELQAFGGLWYPKANSGVTIS